MFNELDSSAQILIIIAVIAIIVALAAIVVTLHLSSKLKKFQNAYISLQTFLSGAGLEDLLKANLNKVGDIDQLVQQINARLTLTENKLRLSADRAELIRFNSFQNMGADLSFALALLNQEGTGVVLTGIHSIEECRIYAKPIENGQASVKLIPEEKQAIERACNTIKI